MNIVRLAAIVIKKLKFINYLVKSENLEHF